MPSKHKLHYDDRFIQVDLTFDLNSQMRESVMHITWLEDHSVQLFYEVYIFFHWMEIFQLLIKTN